MKKILFFFLVFLISTLVSAQSTYLPLDEAYYHRIDRYEIKAGRIFPQIFTGVKPYKRADAVAFIDSIQAEGLITSKADQFNYDYLRNDSWEWARPATNDSKKPFLNSFYKKKSDLFYVDVPEFDLHVNPVLYVGAGADSELDNPLFINTRGVEVRGMVDKKVGFYTYLADNQARLPSYVQHYQSQYWVIPHQGFWKSFKNDGVDFLSARGYISFEATRHINLQLGYDRFFIGNGFRSLILSDFAPPVAFFKAAVKVWKLNYLYSISQMKADAPGTSSGSSDPDGGGYPNKYVAFHHLSVNVGKRLNVGVFETVVFSPDDSLGTGSFEVGYLNPIIFFRAMEQQNGSSDNVILGFDFKWNAIRQVSLYGQFVLDEFKLEHIKARDGWWGNKFGVQAGIKYIDALNVSNLDLQLEANIMRPYTYSHNTNYANYSNFLQSSAHPLGANFKEIAGIARYQPLPRLNLTGKLMYIQAGRDTTGVDWGGDILKSNSNREQEYNNTTGQGIANDILFAGFTASWMLRHNLFIDGQVIIRKSRCDVAAYDYNTTMSFLALRWNIAQRNYDF